MRSRPCLVLLTSPALESTSRCLVMAWRETSALAASCVIEPGPPADRRLTRASRVSSPSAANSGATRSARGTLTALALGMASHVLHLNRPTLAVLTIGFEAAWRGQAFEARFHDSEHCALRRVLEFKLDQSGVIPQFQCFRIGAHGPAERKQALWLHAFDLRDERRSFMTRIGHLAADALTSGEVALEFDTKPGAELLGTGERAPDAASRRADQDASFDAVSSGVDVGCGSHMQSPGCILTAPPENATHKLHLFQRRNGSSQTCPLPRRGPSSRRGCSEHSAPWMSPARLMHMFSESTGTTW